MSGSRKPLTRLHYLEYWGARAFGTLLAIMPLPLAVFMGQRIAGLFALLDRRHRLRVEEQMTFVLSETHSPAEIKALAREMYLHFGTMLAEIVRVPTLTPENIDTYIDWDGNEARLRDLLAEGKGLIYVTGHIGNWEIGGAATSIKGLVSGAIARPLDNPLIDRYVRGLREGCGQKIWDKFGVLKAVLRVLRKGEAFGMLLDQDGGQAGAFVPFFGKEASTLPTAAELALRTGAPIVVAALQRSDRPMRFVYRMREVIRADPTADPIMERQRLLLAINRDLEAIILAAPAQWLWLHRRWKTRPKNENASNPTVARGVSSGN